MTSLAMNSSIPTRAVSRPARACSPLCPVATAPCPEPAVTIASVEAAISEITGLLGGAGLLVNTTTLGMVGQPPLEVNLRCPASLVVADLVYDPLETALLKAARARGLRTADGLGMLLHQAVRGFELWFGIRPQVTAELRALVEADLGAKAQPAAQEKVKLPAKPKPQRRNKKRGEGFSA